MKLKEYLNVGPVFSYLIRVFKKKDPSTGFNLKVMHGINKVSIVMFLIALVVMVSRAFLR
ncbi:hypothetical protein RCC89_09020 [Cytophagaceae bacterium ABcell3]|nr:hypothetical protein RCC89_09020 [Cytophagaceae bacterium ABcell3]